MEENFVKQLFDYLNNNAGHHLESADNLKEFMRFLGKMQSPISIRNKLLTFGYNPGATDIHTRDEWLKYGISVLDEDAMIYNLQKNPESPMGYEERVMYDVSSTDAEAKSFETFPDAGFFAERLLMYPPCPVKYRAGSLENNRKAYYDPEKGIIEVTGGYKDEAQVCQKLLQEYAHFYFCEMDGVRKVPYDREKHSMEALAVSYAVCIRYDIKPPQIDVVSPPMGKAEDRIEVLKGLDTVLGKISKRIDEGGVQQQRFLKGTTESEQGRAESQDNSNWQDQSVLQVQPTSQDRFEGQAQQMSQGQSVSQAQSTAYIANQERG